MNFRNTIGEFNQWYKFNDMSVERFDMTDESIAVECFGGEYKVSQSDSSKICLYKKPDFVNIPFQNV